MAVVDAFNSVPRKSMPYRRDKYLLDGISLGQKLHGNIRVGQRDTGEVLIDGQNNRILIHDGTTNRVVIGNV